MPTPTARPSLAARFRQVAAERAAFLADLTPAQRRDFATAEAADAAALAAFRALCAAVDRGASGDEVRELIAESYAADRVRDGTRAAFLGGRDRRERLAREIAQGQGDDLGTRESELRIRARAHRLEGLTFEAAEAEARADALCALRDAEEARRGYDMWG